jgi:hypothetical protein
MDWDIFVLPTGPRRPSVRVGYPWLACFLVWLVAARVVLHTCLQTSWWFWCVMGTLVLPAFAVMVSLPLGIPWRPRRASTSMICGLGATVPFLLTVSSPTDFATFAFLGGFAVAAVVAVTYALATASALDARRD